MNNPLENRQDINTFLNTAVKLSGIAASMSLLLSIIYDYSYFTAFNISFFDVPSSISDHLRSGLIWFPPLFFGVVVATLFELLTVRIENGMSEDEIVSSSKNPQKTEKIRQGPIKLMPWVGGMIIVSYILFGEVFIYGLPIAFCLVWFRIAPWLNSHSRIFQRRSKILRAAIFWLPAIFIILYGKGYTDGKHLINENTSTCSIIFKNSIIEQEPIILIKLLEKGILFKRPTQNTITYEKWDNVLRMEKVVDNSQYQGVISIFFSVSFPYNEKAKEETN